MNQTNKIQEGFVFCAAITLFSAAAMLLWTAYLPIRVLDGGDPFLPLSSRNVFYLAGGCGLTASAFLLAANSQLAATKLLLIAWLTANYLAYTIGLRLTNGTNLFSCLGNVNNGLAISPKILDWILWVVVGGLLAGASLLLFFDWFARRKPTSSDPKPLVAPNNR